MNLWRPLPLLRLFFPFASGIVAGQICNFHLPSALALVITGVSCLVLILIQRFSRNFKYRWIQGTVILLAFFVSGYQLAAEKSHWRDNPTEIYENPVVLLVQVNECPQLKPGSATSVCDILSVHDGKVWKPSKARIYLRVFNRESNPGLSYGSSYLVHGLPEKLVFFSGAHSFNFREYLHNKGVRFEMTCNASHYTLINQVKYFSISSAAFEARNRLLQIFRDKNLDGQEFAVAAALLLGYVNDIDSRLKSAYAASGTMHILSVSGMHVGIIFLFLDTILAFLLRFKRGIYLKSAIQLLFVWIYAAITGFSPAVLRASACLSFLVIGKTIKRKPEMLNVISASLFLLLLINPLIISDVGFQLSYIAVLGIVILYKPIYDLYVTHRWLPDKIWALMAVSMAAQIATCPLSLYYFHRFPNYFLLSNLIIVPLSNGIILMGILALLCSSIPVFGGLVISALRLLLICLNKSVLWIGSLPGAVTSGFFPDLPALVLMYLIITFAFLFLSEKRPAFLILTMTCLVLLQVSEVNQKLYLSSHYRFSVHKGNQGYVIRFVKGRKEICFYSGLRMRKDPYIAAQIGNERMACRVDQVQERYVSFNGWQRRAGFSEAGRFGNMIVMKGKRVYLLEHPISKNFHEKVKIDILLICTNSNFNMEQMITMFSPKLILNLSTAYRTGVSGWANKARKRGVAFYDLNTAGFYQEEF